MFPNKKSPVWLALIILTLFLAPEIFYWVTLDNFKSPWREISGDYSLYASQLNAVLQHGQPTGNPYFAENQYQIGRFYIFGTLFSFIPLAEKVPIGWWLIVFKIAAAVLVFYLFARLLALFNSPARLTYIFSFIFVLFYGAITFKGGSALYNWFLPAWLAGFLTVIRFFKSEKINLAGFSVFLISPLLFAFHPLYFTVGIALSGLLWLYTLYAKRFERKILVFFLIWLAWTLFLFSRAFWPFVFPPDAQFAEMAAGMTFRNTLINTHFPFLFLFGLRYLLLVLMTGLLYRQSAKTADRPDSFRPLFLLSLVVFLGLNSYVITGRYFLNDHFPFFEEFIIIPLALLLLFGPAVAPTKLARRLGMAILLVSTVSVLVIWNYLNFKPVYFGAEVPQYLAYFTIGLLLSWPGLRGKLFFRHGRFLLKSLLIVAVFHIVFMTFWDDKYWFPLHRQVQNYRGLIENMKNLPDGVVLANPYISNLALIYTRHKVYWSPIAFHDLVATEELRRRWLTARVFFPAEPAFNGQPAVVSIFGRRDNKCREFKRGVYLGWLARLGFPGPQKTICDDPILRSQWPALQTESEIYRQAAGQMQWQPAFQLDYLLVEKGKDQIDQSLVSRYFGKISEDEKFILFSYQK